VKLLDSEPVSCTSIVTGTWQMGIAENFHGRARGAMNPPACTPPNLRTTCGRSPARATRPSWITSSRLPRPLALIGGKPDGTNSNSWFVFSTTYGAKPFSGFSKAKVELDKAIADIRAKAGRAPMPPWVLHDLRRTARSLMSRAKVPTDHAERALGHVMGGVRETYDRYEYLDEKRAAFEALAALVAPILNPTANVEELASRRAVAVTP
jgi:hypothetical protein